MNGEEFGSPAPHNPRSPDAHPPSPRIDRSMDGIINFHKPTGITSAKALYAVRKITGRKKSGHAGTLDPGASGVLVLCMGRATKLVEAIMDQPKVYRATGRLDVTSDSLDSDSPLIPVTCEVEPKREHIDSACAAFEGDIEQVPPKISAVKVGGVPAYKLARRNEVLELRPRMARIYWLHVHAFDWPVLEFEMCCGRGTYVRSLIRDLGERLGTGGCLTSLVRTRVGPFGLDEGWSFDGLESAASAGEYLIGMDSARKLLDPEATVIPDRPES